MSSRFETPADAETAFYRAFEANDLAAMMAVWDEADDVVCVHPMGRPLRGVRAVREGWRELFGAEVAMRFGVEAVQVSRHDDLAIHIVMEHILVPNSRPVAPMTATNIYRRTPLGWRMVLHHASPAPGTATATSGHALH